MLRLAIAAGALLLTGFGVAYGAWYRYHPGGPALIDFSAYYAAGRVWVDGGNPFGLDIWNAERVVPGVDASRHAVLPFVGPPLGLPLWALFGRLAYAPGAAVWAVLMIGAAAIVFATPVRIVGRSFTALERVSLGLLAVVNGPVVTAIAVGQASLPAIAAIDVAILCAFGRRWWLTAVATVVAGLLKPNVALVLLAAVIHPGALVALGVAGAVSLAGNALLAGAVGGVTGYLHVLAAQTTAERWFAFQFTPASIAYSFGLSEAAAATAGTIVGACALTAVCVFVATRRPALPDAVALACCAFPFAIPYVHEPDLAILIFPAFLVVFRARGSAWVAGAIGIVLVSIDPFALALGPLGRTFGAITAAVAALQLAALAPPGLERLRLIPLGLVPLVVALGFFAPAQNLPMWPDALPADATRAGSNVNEQWHDELVASGLEDRHPWVALVRLVTLLGAAGIGIGLARSVSGANAPARAEEPAGVVQAA